MILHIIIFGGWIIVSKSALLPIIIRKICMGGARATNLWIKQGFQKADIGLELPAC